jgi:hypothetical protein
VKLPKTVYVGPYDYNVKLTKSLGDSLYGETDNTNSEILVHPEQSKSSRRDTFLHEVLHAIFHTSGASKALGWDMKTEEQLIRLINPWLVQVLQDNPDLIAYLTITERAA